MKIKSLSAKNFKNIWIGNARKRLMEGQTIGLGEEEGGLGIGMFHEGMGHVHGASGFSAAKSSIGSVQGTLYIFTFIYAFFIEVGRITSKHCYCQCSRN